MHVLSRKIQNVFIALKRLKPLITLHNTDTTMTVGRGKGKFFFCHDKF